MATQAQPSSSSNKQSRPSGVLPVLQKGTKSFQTFFTKFNNDWAMSFAGLLAYNLLMAMLPIAIAIVAILGFFLGSTNLHAITEQITRVFPGAAEQQNALQLAETQLAKDAGILLLIAIVLAIFGGSRLFISIEGCLDIIYRVRPRTMIRQNLIAIAMFLLFLILIPIMIFASAAPTVILGFLSSNPQLNNIPFFSAVVTNQAITYLTSIVGAVIAGFILFEAIYFVVPNQRISWRNSWPGALVAAIALELFLILFPIYARYALGGYAGQIGFAVILLIFFYYFAVILMLGAEVNAYFFEGLQPIPNDLATFISAMAGTVNRDRPQGEAHPHANARPTEQADQAYVAAAREQEKQNTQEDMQKQVQLSSQARASDKREKKKKSSTQHSKLFTALEVAAGSALAMLIELQHLRRHDK
ncbi:MAG TPA: YihY/virulence factor BrkB family protein [Ktedonosporobacter sp.]|nr:YihY/virulence factor BrkB family protein [Ktedonosporobacter sp.]